MKIVLALLISCLGMQAQRCESISASFNGDWRPVATAPRDGTIVEMLETYGIAPWYGIFRWTRERPASIGQLKSRIRYGIRTGRARAFTISIRSRRRAARR